MDAILEKQYLPYLVEQKVIKQQDIEDILKEAQVEKVTVSEVLLKRNTVSASAIETFLKERLGVAVVDPMDKAIPPDVIARVSQHIAKKYSVIPVAFADGVLSLAVLNPFDLIVMDDLRIVLSDPLQPMCALPSKIREAYQKYYEQTPVEEEQDLDFAEIIAEATGEDLEVVERDAEAEIEEMFQGVDETPVIKVTNLILTDAIKRRASDIFIEPWEKHMSVRCRVDGLLESLKAPPKSMANAIVSRIKVVSNLDIAERRIPQDGRFKIKFQDRFVEFRVSVLPSSFGEKVCLRILDKKSQSQQLSALGFTEAELERIKASAAHPHGMILVTGPTGSGKTSTLYSILAHIDSPDMNITTVEDPVEYQIYGINQVNIKESVGLTFSAALRSILRQDPDVIMVGEIRDYTTMDIAIKAALTGHLVLSTLHTNDACGAIVRITNMGIEPFLISSSVLMVSAQRLVRRLCPDCKEGFEPPPQMLKDLYLDPDKKMTFYRAVGCGSCRETGFVGRTVITEVLPLSPTIRELVMKKETAEVIKQQARREGMTTLRESGLFKVIKGDTTLDEVFRVTIGDAPLEA